VATVAADGTRTTPLGRLRQLTGRATVAAVAAILGSAGQESGVKHRGCCIASIAAFASVAPQEPAEAAVATVATGDTVAAMATLAVAPGSSAVSAVAIKRARRCTMTPVAGQACEPTRVAARATVESVATGALEQAAVTTVTRLVAGAGPRRVAEAIAQQQPRIGIRRCAVPEEFGLTCLGLAPDARDLLVNRALNTGSADANGVDEWLRILERPVDAIRDLAGPPLGRGLGRHRSRSCLKRQDQYGQSHGSQEKDCPTAPRREHSATIRS
jgi:hypothetical protein